MQKKFQTLYGVSSKGKVKVWEIWVEQNGNDFPSIVIVHGQLNGKMQVSPEVIREGKNIGRSNETTPWDQACLEAESKWKKQLDKNYSTKQPDLVDGTDEPETDQPTIGAGKLLLPMLAQKFNERKKYILWPAYVQPKLNGVRCLVQRIGDKIFYWSRKSKEYKNFNLYMDMEFLSFMRDGDILDGEMYNHGDITFQQLISLIKDQKTPNVTALKEYVKFWCYDIPSNEGFNVRYLGGKQSFPGGLNYLRNVPTIKVLDEDEVKMWHGRFVEDGFEGTMVRSGSGEGYVFQYRSNQLQKYKDFIDEEFVILGAVEGKGKDEGCAVFHCQSNSKLGGSYGDGTFDVRIKSTYDERRDQWKNRDKYVGKQLTVRYQTLSDDGIPIFPVGIIVRDYE